MKPEFKIAVANKDIAKVRISLSNELLLDPRGGTFHEMLLFAQQNISNLFDKHIELKYSIPPQDKWDESFMFRVKNDLDFNFSKEKLTLYESVVKIVGKTKADKLNQEDIMRKKGVESNYHNRVNEEQSSNEKIIPVFSIGRITLALIKR